MADQQLDGEAVEISVIIPAYNESARLPATLEEIWSYLGSYFKSFEVLVVDDGSTDDTCDFVRKFSETHSAVRLASQPRNLGKGAAVRRGCLEAVGDLVLFMDADHATPISSIESFLTALKEEKADVITGVRTYQSDESRFRRIIGLVGLLLAHLIVFQQAVVDSQCGFKLFTRDAVRRIFPYCRVDSCMFDVEIFYLIHKFGLKCRFVPVMWKNKPGTTINIPLSMLDGPFEMMGIRVWDIFGVYSKVLKNQPWSRAK